MVVVPSAGGAALPPWQWQAGTFCNLTVPVPERCWSVPVCKKKPPHFLCLCFESLALRIDKGEKIWVSYGMHVKYTCPSQLSANAASLLSSQLRELVQDKQHLQNW